MRICSVCLAATFGTFLAGSRVEAVEWYTQSSLEQDFSYDDNIGLDTSGDQKRSEFGSTSTANLALGGRAPNMEVHLRSTFDYAAFPSDTSLNSDDQRVFLGASYFTERTVVGLEGGFVRDTTRTSDVDDTGRFILDNKRRELYQVGPTWTYQLTPRNSVNAFATYSTQSASTKDLDSFWQLNGGFGYSHRWSPRTVVEARASTLHFKTGAGGSRTTDSMNVQVGGSHDFSERWQASFFAGPSLTWTDDHERFGPQQARQRTSNSGTSLSYALNGNVSYQVAERTALLVDVSRGVTTGTTTASSQETTAVGLSLNHQLLEMVAVDASARYSFQDSVGGSGDQNGGDSGKRDFLSFSPGVRWRLNEDLTLRCSYRFRWQRYDNTGDTANSNAVFGPVKL